MRRTCLLASICLLLTHAVRADVIVNEVMANEPGSSVTLEWIELYNTSPNVAQLSLYQLQIGSKIIPLSDTLTGYGYLVIARHLIATTGSPGFESRWGNNSGVWGDDPVLENYPVVEKAIALRNDSGSVRLIGAGQINSEISWTKAGGDGVSWERRSPTSSTVGQCIDPSGSTPGRENSLVPRAHDLSVDTVTVASVDGVAVLTFYVRNIGLNSQSTTPFVVTAFDSADVVLLRDSLPPTDTGFTTVERRSLSLPGMYRHLQVLLPHDDRDYNNRFGFMAPGSDFPPLILSEFLANPTGTVTTEWVELKNRYDRTVSFKDWRITSGADNHAVTHTDDSLAPSAYLVVAQDTSAFRTSYPSFRGILRQPPSGWPTLSNSSDSIVLSDPYGIEADRFVYSSTYDSNYTWCRGEEPGVLDRWGRSTVAAGSPGEENRVLFGPEGSGVGVTIVPQVFSPDGDGVADSVSLRFTASARKKYTAKIYDRGGRVVRTLFEHQTLLSPEYFWDGRGDDSARLPIGIYILYFEVEGVESLKKTLVIAR